MPIRSAAPQFELLFASPAMGAFTRADSDGVVRKYIGGTASSTMEDLKESIIMPEAQQMMLDKLHSVATRMNDVQGGMTAWLNHDYNIPEDCLGAFTAAALTTRIEDGKKYIDLDIECRLTESNPRAAAAYAQVEDGIRHGWSIGAYFTDIKWASDDPDDENFWKMLVMGVELLEISLVGIPANQRAWVRDAESAKAHAVAEAERITIETYGRTQRRGFVQRALIEQPRWGAMGLALADDLRIRSKQPHLEAANVEAFTRTADTLERRDDGGELSPDDARDKILEGIGHLTKLVGHGCCVKSATSASRCLNALAAAIGSPNGGAGEPAATVNAGDPDGDEDPNQILTAAVRKLEPKAGDVIVLSGANLSGADIDALRASWKAMDFGKNILLMAAPEGATVDLMLVDKREELTKIELELAASVQAILTASQRVTDLDGLYATKAAEEDAEIKKIEGEIELLKAERDKLTADTIERDATVTAERETLNSELEVVRGEIETARAERDAMKTEYDTTKAERETVIADIATRKAERLGRLSKSANPNDLLATQGETYMKPEHYKATYAEKEAALKRQAGGAPPRPTSGRDIALAQEQQK
jgi:HK97 family phage prohead protease